MHTVHFIAVEADDEEEAISAAEGALEPYGNGQVWDWFEVGGRWAGILDGKNTLNYEANPELWEKTIEGAYERMDEEFQDQRNRVLGREITVADVGDKAPLGMEIHDKEAYAKRVSENNRDYGAAFSRLLEWERVPRKAEGLGAESQAAYSMHRLCLLAMGRYTFESPLLDGVDHSCWRTSIDERCAEKPSKQWLVAVDLHN